MLQRQEVLLEVEGTGALALVRVSDREQLDHLVVVLEHACEHPRAQRDEPHFLVEVWPLDLRGQQAVHALVLEKERVETHLGKAGVAHRRDQVGAVLDAIKLIFQAHC